MWCAATLIKIYVVFVSEGLSHALIPQTLTLQDRRSGIRMMTCQREISAGGGDKLTNLLAIDVVIAAQDKRLTCGHRGVIFESFKQKKRRKQIVSDMRRRRLRRR